MLLKELFLYMKHHKHDESITPDNDVEIHVECNDGEEQPNAAPPTDPHAESDPQSESPNADAAAPEEKESEVDKLKRELEEMRDKFLYLQADYQNYRKRTAKDIADARIYGAAGVLEPFLTVYDFLNMAKAAAEKSDNIESIRQGLNMILGEYVKALDENGVKKVTTVGSKFDPELHEAVANEPSDTIPEGEIIREWSGGYQYGSRLLRPARVVVSSGPAPAPEEENAADKE